MECRYRRLSPKRFETAFIITALLTLAFTGFTPANGSDLVLNNGFELESTYLWAEKGTVLPSSRGVTQYNVSISGGYSWAYYQDPGDGFDGGVEQILHVQAGVTYMVSADFCYCNC